MEIWNINPTKLNYIMDLDDNHYFDYTFLNIFDFNVSPYYNIIKSLLICDLIKFYKYLYLRSMKLNKKFPTIINKLESMNDIDSKTLNDILLSYIGDNILIAIFIFNSIELYGHY